jgi:hypothetical protein
MGNRSEICRAYSPLEFIFAITQAFGLGWYMTGLQPPKPNPLDRNLVVRVSLGEVSGLGWTAILMGR